MLRRELAMVIRQEEVPCILVTHSIVDALAMADRVAVIERGRIVASGSPEEVVHNPVYGFTVSENPNLFRGEVWVKETGAVCVRVAGVDFRVVTTLSGTVSVAIRPEELILSRERFASSAVNVFCGVVERVVPAERGEVLVYVDVGLPLAAAVTEQSVERLGLRPGERVMVTCKATAVAVFT